MKKKLILKKFKGGFINERPFILKKINL